MGLEKAIFYGKEHRRPYYDSRRFDTSCRNHGGKTKKREHGECPWCKSNRLHNNIVKDLISKEQLKDFELGVYA